MPFFSIDLTFNIRNIIMNQIDHPSLDKKIVSILLFFRIKRHLCQRTRYMHYIIYLIEYKCVFDSRISVSYKSEKRYTFPIRKIKEIARTVVKLTCFKDVSFSSWLFARADEKFRRKMTQIDRINFLKKKNSATIANTKLFF